MNGWVSGEGGRSDGKDAIKPAFGGTKCGNVVGVAEWAGMDGWVSGESGKYGTDTIKPAFGGTKRENAREDKKVTQIA
jgi:hypothetical protein